MKKLLALILAVLMIASVAITMISAETKSNVGGKHAFTTMPKPTEATTTAAPTTTGGDHACTTTAKPTEATTTAAPATTTAAATTAVAATTTAKAADATTAAAAEEKGGCGSSLAISALVMIPTLAGGVILTSKKRKED